MFSYQQIDSLIKVLIIIYLEEQGFTTEFLILPICPINIIFSDIRLFKKSG